MIKIINVKPESPNNESTYEVWVNNDLLATFKHKRIDGIGKCLKLAGEAAEKAKWEQAYRVIKELK